MIDQARYKHQQHRTKFKEAIDYLDQIFEDLKKECEPTSPNGNDARSPPSERNPPPTAAVQLQRQHSGTQLKPKAFPVHTNANLQPPREHPRLQKSVSQDASGQDAKTVGRTIQQPPQQQQQQQQRIIQPIRVGPQLQQQPQQPQPSGVQRPVGQRLPLKKQRSNVEGGDVEVSQTIVLPSKNTAERLDFTRQWLSDDIRSWVDRPAAGNDAVLSGEAAARGAGKQIASDQSSEHSLGSCSAEVAAINATEKRRKPTNGAAGEAAVNAGGTGVKTKKTTNPQPQPPKQVAQPVVAAPTAAAPAPNAAGGPIKPRAWRPQAGGSQQPAPPLGGLIGMAVEHAYELQKMGSQQELARPATRESLDRPGSHDYQSIGSTHSTDGLRSANFNSLQRSVSGAFVQYPQRGSIQSLPDAVLVAGNTRFAQLAPAGSSATLQPGGVYANGTTLQHAPSNTSGYGSTLGSTHHLQPHDPVLAMNTLIAELDLNTEQQPSPTAHHNDETVDKRRSFPTTQTEVTFRAGGRSQSIGQPNATAGGPTASSPGPTRLNVPQQPIYTGSMDRGMRKIQQQQPPQLQQTMNPFTSKVLGPQKPQQPRDPQRAQFEDAAHLLDSVIDELQPKSPSPTAKKRGMLHQLLSGGKSQPPAVQAGAVHRTPLAQKQQAAADGGGRPFLIGSKKPTGAVVGNTTQPLQPKPSPTTTIRSVVGGGKKTVINPPKPNAHLHGHGAVVGGQQGRAAGHETSSSNPFETINSERANPSRVETLGSMFEQRPAQHANVRAAPQRGPSFRRNNSRDSDPAYSEIGEFGRAEEQQQQQQASANRTPSFKANNRVVAGANQTVQQPVQQPLQQQQQQHQQSTNGFGRPSFPTSQPPQRFVSPPTVNPPVPPPLQRNSSLNSRPTFGAAGEAERRPMGEVEERQREEKEEEEAEYVSAGGEREEADGEEGDIYDNLRLDERRNELHRLQQLPPLRAPGGHFGGPPLAAHPQPLVPPQPPPHRFPPREAKGAGARIGQLIRKLGGVSERPIVMHQHLNVERMPNAGSVLSLNRIEHQDHPKRAGMLMKSNSLSHEPWRIHAMDRDFNYNQMEGGNANGMNGKMESFGNRLKQTIFGSKKWLNS
ncbi:hypothetical protein M3Y99_01005200 [Aphelenchoides fujianensis]|nr:hypothetical protein M3Y99_01005200 [Aphelenchoides fujianensis]